MTWVFYIKNTNNFIFEVSRMADEKEQKMLSIAKKWDEYLFKLSEEERKAVFRDRDKYWSEFQKFEKIFFEEHINK